MSLLVAKGVCRRFGGVKAVDLVDLVVEPGQIVSVIGPNGAGKTTFFNCLTGLFPATSGTIEFQGADITRASVHQKIGAGIARSFQLVNLFDDLSVLDNVALSIFAREGKTKRIFALAERDAAVTREASDLLGEFGLGGKSEGRAGGLAQGERKLLDVAVAYALRPKLLFLDEPTSGVSTRDKAQIMDTVSAVVRGGRITAVVIEHDMDVVFKYSDRVVVMHEGRFLADGPPDEIRRNSDVAKYLLGTDV